jgi:hypothetical protein
LDWYCFCLINQTSLSGACSNDLYGSNGLSGGLDVITNAGGGPEVAFLPNVPINGGGTVPEPSTLELMAVGIASLRLGRALKLKVMVRMC